MKHGMEPDELAALTARVRERLAERLGSDRSIGFESFADRGVNTLVAEANDCWFIDTGHNEESLFVRYTYVLDANDPYKSLETMLKAEINEEVWETLHSDTSRPFDKSKSGRIAVKVINHLGDEVMMVYRL